MKSKCIVYSNKISVATDLSPFNKLFNRYTQVYFPNIKIKFTATMWPARLFTTYI